MIRRVAGAATWLEKRVVTAELSVIVLALALMLLSIVLNVIDRTFNLPWPDLSEVALIGMSALAFVGSAHAVYSGGHIVVDFGDLIPEGAWRRWGSWLADLAVIVMSALILIYGKDFLTYVLSMDERTPELDLPVGIPAACLIGGSALSIFHVICRHARGIAGLGPGDAPPEIQQPDPTGPSAKGKPA